MADRRRCQGFGAGGPETGLNPFLLDISLSAAHIKSIRRSALEM